VVQLLFTYLGEGDFMEGKCGIVGYGVYIPRFRIKSEEYVKAWGIFAAPGVKEKAVAGFDEDPITMAIEASMNAINYAGIDATDINCVYFASSHPPYAEKLMSSTISTAIGAPSNIATSDFTSSTKAGTAAMLAALDFVASGRGDFALVVAADSPYADFKDFIEHRLGSGAVAFIIGKEDLIAFIEGIHSVSMEFFGERFRKSGEKFLRDLAIRSYAKYALNKIYTMCVSELLRKIGRKPDDYKYVVFQQFDGRTPLEVALRLGFKPEQVTPTLLCTKIGDTGSASCLISLASILDAVNPNERILVVSYGAGAGSDALSIVVTENIKKKKDFLTVEDYLEDKEYVDYLTYLKFKRGI